VHKIVGVYFEKKYGISTSQPMSLPELSLHNPLFRQYRPTSYLGLLKCLASLQIENSDVFLDYGSGMGRVCIVAASRPFKKIIGIEISKELNRIACDNIKKAYDKLKYKNIHIVEANAAEYQLPHEVTVCFLFNPFRGEILRQVFENMKKSLDIVPRKLIIIYCHAPDQWQSEANCDWVTEIKEVTFAGQPFHIYVNK
jgi:16S rRNA G966 N2-methylase RsmD